MRREEAARCAHSMLEASRRSLVSLLSTLLGPLVGASWAIAGLVRSVFGSLGGFLGAWLSLRGLLGDYFFGRLGGIWGPLKPSGVLLVASLGPPGLSGEPLGDKGGGACQK